jgi:hypothetical protein
MDQEPYFKLTKPSIGQKYNDSIAEKEKRKINEEKKRKTRETS